MNRANRMSRRTFVITTASVGGGMAISLALPRGAAAARDTRNSPNGTASEIGPWITIAPDDTVVIRVATPESGNGVMTQCAMTVTEELHCDWSKVRVEPISLNRNYREDLVYSKPVPYIATFAGRSTIPDRMKLLLQLGASARERLKLAAAERWGVPVSEIQAREGVLTHPASNRTLRYGDVASHAATVELDSEPLPKPQREWTFLGKASPTKLTNAGIVDGSGIFGIDVRIPGMRYAALMQSPVHGGRLKRYDFEAIKHLPGVRGIAVVDPSIPRKQFRSELFANELNAPQSAIAVVADHYWQARTALDALPVEWEPGPGAQWKTTEQVYDAAYAALEQEGEQIDKNEGDALRAIGTADRVVEATYLTPFCDQATMEPLNGTALVTAERVDVWHPAAISIEAYGTAAEEAGVSAEKVHFHQTLIGGSFGRRLFGDDVCMVVAVAKQFPGTPIHVIWSREEMTRQGRYRVLQALKLTAALDEQGMPTALLCRNAHHGFSLNGLIDSAYANGCIPNVRIESTPVPLHILHGAYRAPGYNSHAFFVESFIDECAAAAGIDPLEYRLRLSEKWADPGWRRCLEEVAAKSGWGKTLPKGRAQGIAISNWGSGGKPQAGTSVAAVATVSVTPAGALTIDALDVAFDCGRLLNQDAALAQIQGGVLFGLNMALNEGLTIQDGRIVEGNFHEYPILNMAQIPKKLSVHLGGLSGHDRFSEVGEPPMGPVGPAVANAIYRATGKRIRTMPFRKHDLRWS